MKSRIIFHLNLVDLCLFIIYLFYSLALLKRLKWIFWLSIYILKFFVLYKVHNAWMWNLWIFWKNVLNLLNNIIHSLYFFLRNIDSKRIFKFISIILVDILIFRLSFFIYFTETNNLINKFKIFELQLAEINELFNWHSSSLHLVKFTYS